MKTLIFLIGLSLFAGTTTFASGRYSYTQSPDWQKEDYLFGAFRANAPHFWNWLKSQNGPLLEPTGVVVGDPHILNFGDVQLATGGREFSLIDIDDGGPNAPFAGDIIRYAAGNQVSPFRISLNKVFDAYVHGLQGLQMSEPAVLQDALSYRDEDFHSRQEKYLDKMTTGSRFSDKAKLIPIFQSPLEVQHLFHQAREYFEASMAGYQILDNGYKTKTSGGSSGLPRFWYLIQRNQKRHIVEFKLEKEAATSFFSYQGQAVERFPHVAQVYRPASSVYGPYKIVASPAGQFLMRARLNPFLDFEEGDNIHDGQDMSLYIANRLGLWHGQQPASENLLQFLRFQTFEKLVNTYVDLMKRENN
ncbi:DUF2252 family protein [Bdellovibrio sp. HCB288]|uniref:DUF2252 family protein n=1 Tax=Bdellovibrio sp. HCB288 TaxID=3394355 RepID=UPI0039B5BF57